MANNIVQQDLLSKKWKYLGIIDYILPIYIICSVPLFYLGLQYDFLFKGIAILITLIYLVKFNIPKNDATKLFNIFILIVAFSFIQYLYNNRPFICYINDASNYLAAMLFFYIGITDDRPGRSLYHKMVFAIAVVFFVGLYFYITTPSWYVARNLDVINSMTSVQYDENSMMETLRYSAFFGDSYSVSHLSVFCSAIALFEIAYYQGKYRIFAIAFLIVGLISSIASMHRASILGSVIAIIIYVYFNHRTHRYKANSTVFALSVVAVITFIAFMPSFTERIGDILGMVTERVDDNMNLNNALNERKFTKEVMSSMQFFIFGHGLGSGGGSVRAYGFPGITDMQYIKMFFENGLVGAVLFIGIMVRALRRGIKHIGYYLTEIIIIIFILVAMLGSNSLSIYYFIVYPFWYAVGRISNDNYLRKLNNKEWIY